jgi:hypothetical protein
MKKHSSRRRDANVPRVLWSSLASEAKGGSVMERWWNCVIEVTVPFDTPENARNAFTDEGTIDRLFEIFGTTP